VANESEPQAHPQGFHTARAGRGRPGCATVFFPGGVSERSENDSGPSGGNGGNSRGWGAGAGAGLENAISAFDILVARLFFDLGFQDNMNKKFQEKLQVRALIPGEHAAGKGLFFQQDRLQVSVEVLEFKNEGSRNQSLGFSSS